MTYGPHSLYRWRQTATYVDKILKGAKPGDLPVQQPTGFEPAINLKTAKALWLTIPQSLPLRADEVAQYGFDSGVRKSGQAFQGPHAFFRDSPFSMRDRLRL